MDESLPEYRERASSLKPAGENSMEIGYGPTSVNNGAVGVTLWGGDLGFVSVSVQESEGGASGFPQTGDGSDLQTVKGQDLEKRSRGNGTQGKGNKDTGYIH